MDVSTFSTSSKIDAEFDKVCDIFLKVDESIPTDFKHRNTIIKYTKLPEFETKASWSCQNYTGQPRIRRIVEVEDPNLHTSRSLKSTVNHLKPMPTNYTKRKIVTIAEDEERDHHPKFTKKKSISSAKISNRSVGTDREIQLSPKAPRLNLTRYSKEPKPQANLNNANNKKDAIIKNPSYKSKYSSSNKNVSDNTKYRNPNKECDVTSYKHKSVPARTSISKRLAKSSESENEISLINNKVTENLKNNISPKRSTVRSRISKSQPQQIKSKTSYLNEIKAKNKPVTVIHVPLEEKCRKDVINKEIINILNHPKDGLKKIDQSTATIYNMKDVSINTDSLYKTDETTEIDCTTLKTLTKCVGINNNNVEMNENGQTFDDLNIPDVSLTKEKNRHRASNNINKLISQSLPNIQIPQMKVSDCKKHINETPDNMQKNASYLIGRATLTYTTKQKIDFHVVSSSEETSNLSSSPLNFPMSVMSVFKREMKKREVNAMTETNTIKNREKFHPNYTESYNELNSVNCSYLFNSNKLLKPSDIISTINVNKSLLPSDYISEQFQRELNFIDSFFESLQYLENSSLTNKCLLVNKPEMLINNTDINNLEYNSFLSRLENGTIPDHSETIASKSLCLLNLLIRDEQRRAKNLLFVLKMREDALKDFTKSQILWLEKKKKQDNTDISTLKKKQRGALLKLQHECGEMQRMRKALLTLSEKRKASLMKTKKNLELKLNHSVGVDLVEKKKLKRNNVADRNLAPIKCFDLPSSGCDESVTSRPKSDTPIVTTELSDLKLSITSNVKSAEKCIQTGDSILGPVLVNQSTDTAAEHFVVVDGSYLNILFHNLSLPQIFSHGKHYEVNEEALKNIVHTANTHNSFGEYNTVEKLMEQINNRDFDKSSTPSTARSLVEEFDQYYRDISEHDTSSAHSPLDSPDRDYIEGRICELRDSLVQTNNSENVINSANISINTSIKTDINDSIETVTNMPSIIDATCVHELSALNTEIQTVKGTDVSQVGSQTGPLPVPAGAAAVDVSPPDIPIWLQSIQPKTSTSTISAESSSSSQALCQSVSSSMSSLTSPVHSEAEELRRQQLAIEREIKALEQQQCQLLVVREIPDKPPPPYTPPAEAKQPKPPRMFLPDQVIEEKIEQHITNSGSVVVDETDPFDLFIKDFCDQTIEHQKLEQSLKPWDACNLLPQKSETDENKLVRKASMELKDILSGVPPTVVSGVSTRRSDHIDDILFAEWRRCEPEWTTLHADEVIVKNQVFESIFQKVLTEAVDEYKRTVLGDVNNLFE